MMPAVMTVLIAGVFWFGAPLVVRALGGHAWCGARAWLTAAILAVGVGWFLPSPWFADQTQTFTQHLVGGGIASGLVGWYLIESLHVTTTPRRVLLILATVSVLGVANELFELVSDTYFGTFLGGDTPWDLLANTIGALAVAALGEIWLRVRGATPQHAETRR